MWPETPQDFKTGDGADHPDGVFAPNGRRKRRATMARLRLSSRFCPPWLGAGDLPRPGRAQLLRANGSFSFCAPRAAQLLRAKGATNCGSVSHGNRIQVSWLTSVMKVSTVGLPAGLA